MRLKKWLRSHQVVFLIPSFLSGYICQTNLSEHHLSAVARLAKWYRVPFLSRRKGKCAGSIPAMGSFFWHFWKFFCRIDHFPQQNPAHRRLARHFRHHSIVLSVNQSLE
jgi:hypothetical protein